MTRAAASLAFALSAYACALLVGCAAPGDPTARHPVVPTPIADLAARQEGNEVVLTFSLPARSMDREALPEFPAIEIYRAPLPSGATPDLKTPWHLVYTVPSERVDSYLKGDRTEFRDPLSPDELARAAGSPLAYMVRTREVKARASDDSNFFTVRIYSPPRPPNDLRTIVTEPAIVLNWAESASPPGASSLAYRMYRGEIESGQEPVPQDVSQVKWSSPLELVESTSLPEFHDAKFEFGKTYVYTVRSVAQFGADSVESSDSAPAVVTPRDVFPPAAPVGLEIALIPATPQAPAYVELSWVISPEGDLAGYNVYRSDREDTPGGRLNGETLLSPTFRDTTVATGGGYFYRVSAVDRVGNESPQSAPVLFSVP